MLTLVLYISKHQLYKFIFFSFLVLTCIPAQNKDDFIALLDMSLEELLNVKVITASAKEESAIDAPANIFVINKEQIKERNYRTLTDIFPDLPGVVATNLGPSKNVYYTIRGMFDNRRLKVMINGMDINPKSGENLIFGVSRFPVELIEKIEFIIGPYASLYGRNSFSGVLNIITQKGNSVNGITSKAMYSGTYNHFQTEAVIGTKINSYDLLLSLYHNRSDGGRDLVNEYPEIYSLDVRQERRLQAGLPLMDSDVSKEFVMPWNSSNLFFRLEHDNGFFFDFDYNHSNAPKVGAGFQSYLYYQNENTYLQDVLLNTRAGINYSLSNLFLTTTLSYQNYTFDGLNGYLDNTGKWYRNKDHSIIFDHKFRYTFSQNEEFFASITYEKLRSYLTIVGKRELASTKPEWETNDIVDDNFYNISVQYSKNFSNKIKVLAGLVYENSDNKEDIILPRFSVIWHINKNSNIKFLYGAGYLGVDPVSTVDQIVSETNSIKGTKGLKAETLHSYEIYFSHYNQDRYLFSLSLFYNRINNIADIVNDSSLPQPFSRIYKNLGTRKAFGFDIFCNLKISKKIKTYLNYSFIDGHSETEGLRIENLPLTVLQYINLGFNFLLFENNINIRIRNTYITKFFSSSQTELDGYNQCSLSINSTSKLLKKLNISLEIKNLFDKKGFDPAISPASYRSDIPIARRNWNVSFRYNVGF